MLEPQGKRKKKNVKKCKKQNDKNANINSCFTKNKERGKI